MIYKYTKCESVIAKIMADLDASEKNNRVTDIREWIFEAMEKIGAPLQYITKESKPMQICDHQVPIPDELHDLMTVAYSASPDGPWTPMRTNTSSFNQPDVHKFSHVEIPTVEKLPTTQAQLYTYKGELELQRHLNDIEEVTYFLKPGWIVTNKDHGFIKISYRSIASDERGYPLIPDLASYQEAIYWYVVMKLKFPRYLNGQLGGHRKYTAEIYNTITRNWNFYRNQAYAEALMPTEGDIRSIKNQWNKLIPDWDSDDYLFAPVGRRQMNYNDYYYGY